MSFHVIKENDLFYLCNADGVIVPPPENDFGYGLYIRDTRVLSQFQWTAAPPCIRPVMADSSDNFKAVYRYTNTAMKSVHGNHVQDQSILITREQSVNQDGFFEQATVQNYAADALKLAFHYAIDADFADMFEVRGFATDIGSRRVDKMVHKDGKGITFHYLAEDGLHVSTDVDLIADGTVAGAIGTATTGAATLSVTVELPPHATRQWGIRVIPRFAEQVKEGEHAHFGGAGFSDGDANTGDKQATALQAVESTDTSLASVRQTAEAVEKSYADWFAQAPTVTGDEDFATWYNRGLKDLRMLMTDIGYGEFPVAGVPWFAVPFGRDSLITSVQMMMANPSVAKGTLRTMAAFQGTELNPKRDEQPGKIMHELRQGELTRTGRVPFGPYFGTIDATPLFLNLAADYYDWTGDVTLIEELLPVAKRAFDWIEQFGDRDGDSFVEYLREAEGGISNQGWKDSGDSITHENGEFATGSIALCEVQSYVFRAYARWQRIGAIVGEKDLEQRCKVHADEIQKRFLKTFWVSDEDGVALALDGQKQQVKNVSSNMGQVLWGEILPPAYANRVIDRLLKEDMDCGFGIRTLSGKAVAYNPISYHNGSVWPHDNSIIIAGMARYGRSDAVHQVTEGLMRAGKGFELYRLPELFSGIPSREVNRPVPYPVSCSPQAWAAATPILVLQALLGLMPSVGQGLIHLSPSLPDSISELTVEGIGISSGWLSIRVWRRNEGITDYEVLENTTGLQVQDSRELAGALHRS